MSTPGFPELIVILVIVLLVFGGAKLPKLARSLGEAKNEFEKSASSSSSSTSSKAAAKDDEKVTMSRAELDAVLAQRDAKPASGEEKVTLSKAELDALLAEREAKARAAGE